MKDAYKYIKEGMKPKMAIAKALVEKRKMAKGGMVDEEHERSLAELMIEGDQAPVMNPEIQSEEKSLAERLHKAAEDMEYYAMGGLVEGKDGDEKPEPHESHSEEPQSELPSAPLEHTLVEGVPRFKPSPLSEDAKKALEAKKLKRKFMR